MRVKSWKRHLVKLALILMVVIAKITIVPGTEGKELALNELTQKNNNNNNNYLDFIIPLTVLPGLLDHE